MNVNKNLFSMKGKGNSETAEQECTTKVFNDSIKAIMATLFNVHGKAPYFYTNTGTYEYMKMLVNILAEIASEYGFENPTENINKVYDELKEETSAGRKSFEKVINDAPIPEEYKNIVLEPLADVTIWHAINLQGRFRDLTKDRIKNTIELGIKKIEEVK